MSYEFYKIFHLLGLFLAFGGLTGYFMAGYNSAGEVLPRVRKIAAISHGIGMLLLLVCGFGLAARLGYMSGLPGWIYAKIVLWLIFGACLVLVKRFSIKIGPMIYLLLLGIALLGASLAILKP